MLFRSSAAICGVIVALAISVGFARSETAVDHSGAVVAVTLEDLVDHAVVEDPPDPIRPGAAGP